MSALLLKSGNALDASIDTIEFTVYRDRVLADGGFIANEASVKSAFAFAGLAGISSNEVFSATSANWGVRLSGGKPDKLYSLFNEVGDIDVVVGNAPAIDFNTDRHVGTNVIAMLSTQFNALISVGTINGAKSSGICVVSKTRVAASGEDYGNANLFTLADLSDVTNSTSGAESLSKSMHRAHFLRSATSKMPVDWITSFAARGDTVEFVSSESGGILGSDKWLTAASFADKAGLSVYDKGVKVGGDNTPAGKDIYDNLTFNIGRSKTSTISTSYMGFMDGDIAEAWCLVNTTKEKMQALSLRASQKYTD